MLFLDFVLGSLPCFISIYLIAKLAISITCFSTDLYWNYLCCRNMFLMSLFSSILKYILKKRRRSKTIKMAKKTKYWTFKTSFSRFAFPSNHTIFFVNFYLDHPSPFAFVYSVIGILSRVYFEHHTVLEVSDSVKICIIVKILFSPVLL